MLASAQLVARGLGATGTFRANNAGSKVLSKVAWRSGNFYREDFFTGAAG